MSKARYIILIVCAMLCSCEKVMEFDIEESDRMVVVNALPSTDSLLFVNITYSRFFLDNQPFTAVTDATVSIDVNGTTMASTGRDGANYLFGYTATVGDTLTLHVSTPGRPDIIGGTRVVPLPDMLPPLAEIDTLQPITAGEITFTLTDPAEMTNYYYIYLEERDSGTRWNVWKEKWDTIDTVRHPIFTCLNTEITNTEVNAIEGFMDYFTELLFTDRDIDGQSYETTLSLMMLKDTAEHPLQREYTLIVEALSPEAYAYTKEVMAARGMASYFAEPARVYSNLSSGIGIFAAIARRQYPLTFTYKEAEEGGKAKVVISTQKGVKPSSVSASRRSR